MNETAPVSRFQALKGCFKNVFSSRYDGTLKEALEEVLEEHEENSDEALAPQERTILHNVLSFSEHTVSDIVIPRPDVVAVPHDISLEELKAHIMEQRHTRTPVYEDTLDHVLGFLHVKDLLSMLAGDKPFDVRSHLRPMLFVPPSMKVLDLLAKMRKAGSHMAIVVDEHGGTDGLVTMEDVVERIVGEIHDEHDEDEQEDDAVTRISDTVFDMSARMRMESLEQKLGLNLVTEEKENEFDTLGGLIFYQLGRIPTKGEIVEHTNGVRFEILDADARSIHKVRLHTV